jgi:molybdate transport system substrate-binding protein
MMTLWRVAFSTPMARFRTRCLSFARAWVMVALFAAPSANAQTVTVFAAASLTDVLDELAKSYERAGGDKVIASYAGSSALAKQIQNGAPADLFISADLDWMDYLDKRGYIKSESRQNLLRNRLVLVAPADSRAQIDIAPNFPLAKLLGNDRLAMADPDSVPAGKYARAALEALGVWKDVKMKLAPTENVRSALTLVSRGETPLGIVYRTDALADQKIKIVGEFPENTHPPIIYAAALTTTARAPAAAFLKWLNAPAAQSVFRKYGF